MRRNNPNSEKRDWRGAIEDAIVLFFVVLFSNLATYGYPPTPESLYSSIIAAALTFFVSIQRKFKIEE